MRRQAKKNESGRLNAEGGAERRAARISSAFSIPHSAFSLPPFPTPAPSPQPPTPARSALTLIELLVTIVIMVTVLAGVIPLMSPNNNARKIREASRQLSTMLAQAQSQAARDGRPAGVAFREFGTGSPYSGMALEAFMIAEPQAFSGFSEFSQVTATDAGVTYGTPGNGGTLFDPEYRGRPLYDLAFTLNGADDPFPPRMLQIGDKIELGGFVFLVCDDDKPTMMPNQIETGTEYLLSDSSLPAPTPGTTLSCILLSDSGQAPTGARSYRIRRQPANTSDAPLQFPRGIGIDLQASGATGLNSPETFDGGGVDLVGVMFNANGALDGLIYKNKLRSSVAQIFILLGVFENGNNGSQNADDYDFDAFPILDADNLAQRRSRINWLNADSRWVTVNRAGRVVTSANNTSFNPEQLPYIDMLPTDPRDKRDELRRRQLNGVGNNPGAREFAAQMQSEGGR